MPAGGLVDLLQPGPEPQEHHAPALEAARLELRRAAGDQAVGAAERPAGVLAKIDSEEDRAVAGPCRQVGRQQPDRGGVEGVDGQAPAAVLAFGIVIVVELGHNGVGHLILRWVVMVGMAAGNCQERRRHLPAAPGWAWYRRPRAGRLPVRR